MTRTANNKAMASPPAITIYATKAGGTTLDQDECGGNPFATALIELSRQKDLMLSRLLPKLRRLTSQKSFGHQVPTWDRLSLARPWAFPLDAGKRSETRTALVLVVSEYSHLATPRLLGAANDERRIAALLAEHGFSVLQGIAPDRHSLFDALRSFSARSKGFDVALIYSTGHGIELGGRTYLLPKDFPFQGGYRAPLLRQHAVPISRMAAACRARQINLTFFAGCRTEAGIYQNHVSPRQSLLSH